MHYFSHQLHPLMYSLMFQVAGTARRDRKCLWGVLVQTSPEAWTVLAVTPLRAGLSRCMLSPVWLSVWLSPKGLPWGSQLCPAIGGNDLVCPHHHTLFFGRSKCHWTVSWRRRPPLVISGTVSRVWNSCWKTSSPWKRRLRLALLNFQHEWSFLKLLMYCTLCTALSLSYSYLKVSILSS